MIFNDSERVDLNELWNRQLLASRGKTDCYYDSQVRAEAYDLSDAIRKDGETRVELLQVQPDWIVLDIGSGPGTLTIPLAERVSKVTAVEPSKPMLDLLKKNIKSRNICNIDIIHNKWEDISIDEMETYDMVIASYSLNMIDIKDALLKMNALARKKVSLYWFAGTTSWEQVKLDIYPLIKKNEFLPAPKCDLIYKILYNAGIYPDITVLHNTSFPRVFGDLASAVEDLKQRIDIISAEYDDILEAYIKEHYLWDGNRVIYQDHTNYVHICWRKL